MTDARPPGPDASGLDDAIADAELLGDRSPPRPGEELSVDSLVADLERVIGDLERVVTERDQFRDAYQRVAADFDNFRKNAQRRQDDEVTRSVGAFVERLLPVLDACDGAVAHGSSEAEPIRGALLVALEKEGLVRIDPTGEVFDPTVADAVVHDPGSGGEHIVSEVMRAGYTWQGRVLRPAMVRVTD